MADCRHGHVDPPRYKNGNCKPCRYEYNKRIRNAQHKRKRDRRRAEALAAYGGRCACCGEAEEAFLVIDHINDDGKQHREQIKRELKLHSKGPPTGYQTYRWLKLNGYPLIVQVLCANCNMAKARGGCPHQQRVAA